VEELDTYRADLLAALEEVLGQLSAAVARLPALAWQQSIGPGLGTPQWILFHLYALEAQVFSTQLPRMLKEDQPLMPAFDEEAWMAGNYNADIPAAAVLAHLGELRRQELDWLRKLSPSGWSRLSRHPWWGVHTLQWWVELQLDYSVQTLKQLAPRRLRHLSS
jgi:hypothetical protein